MKEKIKEKVEYICDLIPSILLMIGIVEAMLATPILIIILSKMFSWWILILLIPWITILFSDKILHVSI